MRFPGLLGLRRGKTEHFLRVIERGLSHMNAAEHAGNLFDAAFAVELRERADSLTVDRLFLDMQVMDGAAGNLRLMSHTEHLAVMPELLQKTSHHFCDSAADAGVDFVENHRLDWRRPGGDDRNGKTDTGKFTAGGYFC